MVVAVPLLLLAAVATHLTARFSLRQQQAGQVGPEAGSQAAQVASFMRMTPWIFPLSTLVGGLFFPFSIAILLYWLANSVWTMTQQNLVYRTITTQTVPKTPQIRASQHSRKATGHKCTGARKGGYH